ncbi:MAG: hypothetical protein NC343_04020 [Muribaculum sp.]|nr:hypothetical protein [Muribaculaceae bacterium]MCM1080896.1 hypothetical protein [Muribaculum sp.]
MNKKFLSVTVLSLLAAAMSTSFTSCEDYDDDIDNLQVQIDGIKTTVGELEKMIQDGMVVTSVTSTADGLAITFSNGKTYNITNGVDGKDGADGKDGKDGADGKDGLNGKDGADGKDGKDGVDGKDGKSADVWTIGPDGYWWKNGVKTDYKAIGVDGQNGKDGKDGQNGKDGKDGQNGKDGKDGINGQDGKDGLNGKDGKDGQDGKDGENGIYYVPNATTGLFDIYKDGEKIGESNIRWRPENTQYLTAVFTGTRLTISGVVKGQNPDGTPQFGTVDLIVGCPVGSIGFIPSVMSTKVPLPTTDKEFYHIATYLSESKYNASTKKFVPQTGFNKSNIVDLHYRINPSDADVVPSAIVAFIDRKVTSRAAGDNASSSPLLNVLTTKVGQGDESYVKYFTLTGNELTVSTTLNATQLSTSAENNIAALSLWNGQAATVSDYVAISSDDITVALVDSASMGANPTTVKSFYNRDQAIVGNGETDQFIKQFVGLGSAANIELVYTGSVDLRTLPGLYSTDKSSWLAKLGFTGMSYKFSLPAEYIGSDGETNQQWFVQLDGSVLKVNEKNLTPSLTPAIGRTPVVRVDAFLTSNNGTSQLVGSAYIKVSIVKEKTQTPDDQHAIPYSLETKAYDYHSLTATPTLINKMGWKDVNNFIYGKVNLTSSTFWNYYGGSNKEYEVKVTTTEKNGAIKVLGTGTAKADQAYTLTADGISCETTLGSGDTQTSSIKFNVDNKVKTQNTYKDVNGKGAEFVVTITIPSNNKAVRGDMEVKQVFYVKEECKEYEFNPNYYAGTVEGMTNVVVTKGRVVGNTWKLQMNVSEVFKMINGQNIFSYYNTVNNATAINFALNPTPQAGIAFDPTTGVVSLDEALTKAYKFASMKYAVTLVNGETCEFYFNIQFKNPFVAGTAKQVVLDANVPETVTVQTATQVLVNDLSNKAIYKWTNNSLQLTSLATGTYKVADPTVEFEFDTTTQAYKDFVGNLDPSSVFTIDPDTGVVTFYNLGLTQVPSYNLVVKATVTFDKLSKVVVNIPLLVKGEN